MRNSAALKVVVGLGKTGFSCIKYLVKQGVGFAVVDSRVNPPFLQELNSSYPSIPKYLGGFSSEILNSANELVVSPGVSLAEPAIAAAVNHGAKAIGDIELFAREVKAPVIAITGSNGKSTVTSLVGEMAKVAGINVKVGGNLGTPALDLLDPQAKLYVLELSSFQLETTYSLKAAAAVVLNISPDHMDRYKNVAEYAAAKKRIYNNCEIAVINRDDPLSYNAVKLPAKIVGFGLHEITENDFGVEQGYIKYQNKKIFKISELKIKGLHQVANALAALALGQAVKLPMEAMLAALKTFPGLAHRCQWVGSIDGVDWYDDSKGTNVGATQAAVEGLGNEIKGKIILIAGGLGKDADFTLLREVVNKFVKSLILIGQDADKIAAALQGTAPIKRAGSMQEAVEIAHKVSNPNDAVLLSPACASFDMFKNFEHRGEVFAAEVQKLLQFTDSKS